MCKKKERKKIYLKFLFIFEILQKPSEKKLASMGMGTTALDEYGRLPTNSYQRMAGLYRALTTVDMIS